MLCEKAISSKTSVQPLQPSRRGQIPIAQAAPPGAEPTAISCLGAFRTPAASARGESPLPASENLHISGRRVNYPSSFASPTLPIGALERRFSGGAGPKTRVGSTAPDRKSSRSEEHTSELQSRLHLVC